MVSRVYVHTTAAMHDMNIPPYHGQASLGHALLPSRAGGSREPWREYLLVVNVSGGFVLVA